MLSTTPSPALLKWIAGSRRSGCARLETGHAGDYLRIGTQRLAAVEELCERAVRNTNTDIHRLQLFVDERPDATARFDRGQRCKERVDRVSGLRRALGRRRGPVPYSSPAPTASESAAATEPAATATKSAPTAATKSATTAATKFAAAAATEFAAAAAGAACLARLPVTAAATLLR